MVALNVLVFQILYMRNFSLLTVPLYCRVRDSAILWMFVASSTVTNEKHALYSKKKNVKYENFLKLRQQKTKKKFVDTIKINKIISLRKISRWVRRKFSKCYELLAQPRGLQ